MPSSAVSWRMRPSNAKGRVTTPMVSAPASLASSATMAADRVPVPPPMPQVMNTMSESCTTAESSVRLSSAASRPRVQSPPAPSPRVILLPIWTLTSAWQRSSACLSVFTAMNSTLSAFEIIRLTAFPPPPPQPTTLIRARPSCNRLSFMTTSWSEFALAMASSSWFRVCSLEKIAQPPHCFLIRGAERCLAARSCVGAGGCPRTPLHKAASARKRRSLGAVGETGQAQGLAQAHGRVEDSLGGVGGAHQARAAPGDHHAGRQQTVEAALPHLFAGHLEDLAHARADDLGQEPSRQRLDAVAADLSHLDLLAEVDDIGQGVAVVALQGRRFAEGGARSERDVARDVVAPDREHGEVARRSVVVDDHRGGARA